MKHNFPKNLRYYRRKAGMTQTMLGDRLGITHQAVCNYEKGDRDCTIDMLVEISEILNVSVEELLFRGVIK